MQISRKCTPPYLSAGISNLLQPAQAEVMLGQLSTYLASWGRTTYQIFCRDNPPSSYPLVEIALKYSAGSLANKIAHGETGVKGTVQRDLRGGQKWYQSIDIPLIYQRFALESNFIRPPSRNSRKTIQRKLIRIYSNCRVNFKCAANCF